MPICLGALDIISVLIPTSKFANPLDTESDWFVIDEKEYTDENKVKEETFQFNNELNCLWVRFKYTLKSANFRGNISEILYRN